MTQTMQSPAPRLGVLPVSINLLEQLFCLPEGYKIVACHYNEYARTINFTLTSDALPEAQEGCELPRLNLRFTVETLPDQSPEYRRITTEVKPL